MRPRFAVVALAVFVLAAVARPVPADEGMWLLNNLPAHILQQTYGFAPDQKWAEYVQKAAVRFAVDSPNCSSSIVSSRGLVSTNWHCVESALKAISTPSRNVYEEAFVGHALADDIPLPGVYLQQFASDDDITQAVLGEYRNLVARGRTTTTNAILQRMSSQSAQRSGLACEPVVFGGGAEYHIVCYREFRDVRLVFAPEVSIGFFGGDPENFTYPRSTMDQVFVRIYENGKPAEFDHFFSWSETGPALDELLFAAGHPGSTQRRFSAAAAKAERDLFVPFVLEALRSREQGLLGFAAGNAARKSISESDLFSVQNSRKAYIGKLETLTDPRYMAEKEAFEVELLREADAADIFLSTLLREGLQAVADAQEEKTRERLRLNLVGSWGFNTSLRDLAFRTAAGGFRRDQFGNILQHDPLRGVYYLLIGGSEAVVLTDIERSYERAKLEQSLAFLVAKRGGSDFLVDNILRGQTPAEAAKSMVENSILVRPEWLQRFRDRATGSPVKTYMDDPLIGAAVVLLEEYFDAREAHEKALDRERMGYAKIEQAIRALRGGVRYPDATFTLRLTFGIMQDVVENGRHISATTSIGRAFRRAEELNREAPWQLSDRWFDRRPHVDESVPLNFTGNLDITGGNSGSPVFTKDFRQVGTIFDSNLCGLATDYDYDHNDCARSIAVHSGGVIELLRGVYEAHELVGELLGNGAMR